MAKQTQVQLTFDIDLSKITSSINQIQSVLNSVGGKANFKVEVDTSPLEAAFKQILAIQATLEKIFSKLENDKIKIEIDTKSMKDDLKAAITESFKGAIINAQRSIDPVSSGSSSPRRRRSIDPVTITSAANVAAQALNIFPQVQQKRGSDPNLLAADTIETTINEYINESKKLTLAINNLRLRLDARGNIGITETQRADFVKNKRRDTGIIDPRFVPEFTSVLQDVDLKDLKNSKKVAIQIISGIEQSLASPDISNGLRKTLIGQFRKVLQEVASADIQVSQIKQDRKLKTRFDESLSAFNNAKERIDKARDELRVGLTQAISTGSNDALNQPLKRYERVVTTLNNALEKNRLAQDILKNQINAAADALKAAEKISKRDPSRVNLDSVKALEGRKRGLEDQQRALLADEFDLTARGSSAQQIVREARSIQRINEEQNKIIEATSRRARRLNEEIVAFSSNILISYDSVNSSLAKGENIFGDTFKKNTDKLVAGFSDRLTKIQQLREEIKRASDLQRQEVVRQSSTGSGAFRGLRPSESSNLLNERLQAITDSANRQLDALEKSRQTLDSQINQGGISLLKSIREQNREYDNQSSTLDKIEAKSRRLGSLAASSAKFTNQASGQSVFLSGQTLGRAAGGFNQSDLSPFNTSDIREANAGYKEFERVLRAVGDEVSNLRSKFKAVSGGLTVDQVLSPSSFSALQIAPEIRDLATRLRSAENAYDSFLETKLDNATASAQAAQLESTLGNAISATTKQFGKADIALMRFNDLLASLNKGGNTDEQVLRISDSFNTLRQDVSSSLKSLRAADDAFSSLERQGIQLSKSELAIQTENGVLIKSFIDLQNELDKSALGFSLAEDKASLFQKSLKNLANSTRQASTNVDLAQATGLDVSSIFGTLPKGGTPGRDIDSTKSLRESNELFKKFESQAKSLDKEIEKLRASFRELDNQATLAGTGQGKAELVAIETQINKLTLASQDLNRQRIESAALANQAANAETRLKTALSVTVKELGGVQIAQEKFLALSSKLQSGLGTDADTLRLSQNFSALRQEVSGSIRSLQEASDSFRALEEAGISLNATEQELDAANKQLISGFLSLQKSLDASALKFGLAEDKAKIFENSLKSVISTTRKLTLDTLNASLSQSRVDPLVREQTGSPLRLGDNFRDTKALRAGIEAFRDLEGQIKSIDKELEKLSSSYNDVRSRANAAGDTRFNSELNDLATQISDLTTKSDQLNAKRIESLATINQIVAGESRLKSAIKGSSDILGIAEEAQSRAKKAAADLDLFNVPIFNQSAASRSFGFEDASKAITEFKEAKASVESLSKTAIEAEKNFRSLELAGVQLSDSEKKLRAANLANIDSLNALRLELDKSAIGMTVLQARTDAANKSASNAISQIATLTKEVDLLGEKSKTLSVDVLVNNLSKLSDPSQRFFLLDEIKQFDQALVSSNRRIQEIRAELERLRNAGGRGGQQDGTSLAASVALQRELDKLLAVADPTKINPIGGQIERSNLKAILEGEKKAVESFAASNEVASRATKEFQDSIKQIKSGDFNEVLAGADNFRRVKTDVDTAIKSIINANQAFDNLRAAGGKLSKEQEDLVAQNQKNLQSLSALSREIARNEALVNQQEKAAKNAAKGFRFYSEELAETLKSSFRFANAISIFTTAVSALRTAFSTLIEESRAFARSLTVVQSVNLSTAKSAELLKDRVRDASVQFGLAANDIFEVQKQFGSAGFSLETSLRGLSSTLQLLVATSAGAETTARAVAGVYRVFGDQLRRTYGEFLAFASISDTLTAVYRNNQAEIEEVVQGLKFAGSAAAASGFSFEQTTAFLAVLNDNLIKSGTAGRGLQVIFAQLASKADKFGKAFGVNLDPTKTLNAQFLDLLSGVNAKLKSGALTVNELDKRFKFFGLRGARAFITLTEKFEDVERALKNTGEGARGTANELAKVVQAQLANKVDRAKQALLDFAREGLEPVGVALTMVTKAIFVFRDILDKFPAFKKFAASAVVLIAVLGSLIFTIGGLIALLRTSVKVIAFQVSALAMETKAWASNTAAKIANARATQAATAANSAQGAAGAGTAVAAPILAGAAQRSFFAGQAVTSNASLAGVKGAAAGIGAAVIAGAKGLLAGLLAIVKVIASAIAFVIGLIASVKGLLIAIAIVLTVALLKVTGVFDKIGESAKRARDAIKDFFTSSADLREESERVVAAGTEDRRTLERVKEFEKAINDLDKLSKQTGVTQEALGQQIREAFNDAGASLVDTNKIALMSNEQLAQSFQSLRKEADLVVEANKKIAKEASKITGAQILDLATRGISKELEGGLFGDNFSESLVKNQALLKERQQILSAIEKDDKAASQSQIKRLKEINDQLGSFGKKLENVRQSRANLVKSLSDAGVAPELQKQLIEDFDKNTKSLVKASIDSVNLNNNPSVNNALFEKVKPLIQKQRERLRADIKKLNDENLTKDGKLAIEAISSLIKKQRNVLRVATEEAIPGNAQDSSRREEAIKILKGLEAEKKAIEDRNKAIAENESRLKALDEAGPGTNFLTILDTDLSKQVSSTFGSLINETKKQLLEYAGLFKEIPSTPLGFTLPEAPEIDLYEESFEFFKEFIDLTSQPLDARTFDELNKSFSNLFLNLKGNRDIIAEARKSIEGLKKDATSKDIQDALGASLDTGIFSVNKDVFKGALRESLLGELTQGRLRKQAEELQNQGVLSKEINLKSLEGGQTKEGLETLGLIIDQISTKFFDLGEGAEGAFDIVNGGLEQNFVNGQKAAEIFGKLADSYRKANTEFKLADFFSALNAQNEQAALQVSVANNIQRQLQAAANAAARKADQNPLQQLLNQAEKLRQKLAVAGQSLEFKNIASVKEGIKLSEQLTAQLGSIVGNSEADIARRREIREQIKEINAQIELAGDLLLAQKKILQFQVKARNEIILSNQATREQAKLLLGAVGLKQSELEIQQQVVAAKIRELDVDDLLFNRSTANVEGRATAIRQINELLREQIKIREDLLGSESEETATLFDTRNIAKTALATTSDKRIKELVGFQDRSLSRFSKLNRISQQLNDAEVLRNRDQVAFQSKVIELRKQQVPLLKEELEENEKLKRILLELDDLNDRRVDALQQIRKNLQEIRTPLEKGLTDIFTKTQGGFAQLANVAVASGQRIDRAFADPGKAINRFVLAIREGRANIQNLSGETAEFARQIQGNFSDEERAVRRTQSLRLQRIRQIEKRFDLARARNDFEAQDKLSGELFSQINQFTENNPATGIQLLERFIEKEEDRLRDAENFVQQIKIEFQVLNTEESEKRIEIIREALRDAIEQLGTFTNVGNNLSDVLTNALQGKSLLRNEEFVSKFDIRLVKLEKLISQLDNTISKLEGSFEKVKLDKSLKVPDDIKQLLGKDFFNDRLSFYAPFVNAGKFASQGLIDGLNSALGDRAAASEIAKALAKNVGVNAKQVIKDKIDAAGKTSIVDGITDDAQRSVIENQRKLEDIVESLADAIDFKPIFAKQFSEIDKVFIAETRGFDRLVRQSALNLRDLYIGAFSASITNFGDTVKKTFESAFNLQFAFDNAQRFLDLLDQLRQIDTDFFASAFDIQTQLRRNETSYLDYINAIQDAEAQRIQSRLDAEKQYREELATTADVFRQSVKDSISGIFDSFEGFDLAGVLFGGSISESLKGTVGGVSALLSLRQGSPEGLSALDSIDFLPIQDYADKNLTAANKFDASVTAFDAVVSDIPDKVSEAIEEASNRILAAQSGASMPIGQATEQSGLTGAQAQVGVLLNKGAVEFATTLATLAGQVIFSVIQQGFSVVASLIFSIAGQILDQGVEKVVKFINKFIRELPRVISNFTEDFIDGIDLIIDAFVEGLPDIIDGLVVALPKVIDALIKQLVENGPAILKQLLSGAVEILISVVDMLAKNAGQFAELNAQFISLLIDAVPQLVVGIIAGIGNNIDTLILAIFKTALYLQVGIFYDVIKSLINLIAGTELPSFSEAVLSKIPNKFHNGGLIPGNKEDLMIVAQSGEGVLSRQGLRTLGGVDVLNQLNKGINPFVGSLNRLPLQKYHTGGIVGSPTAKGSNTAAGSSNNTTNVGGVSINVYGSNPEAVSNAVMKKLKKTLRNDAMDRRLN